MDTTALTFQRKTNSSAHEKQIFVVLILPLEPAQLIIVIIKTLSKGLFMRAISSSVGFFFVLIAAILTKFLLQRKKMEIKFLYLSSYFFFV